MQKLARAVIGTNNIDNCSRYCQAPGDHGPLAHGRLRRRFRFDLAISSRRPWCSSSAATPRRAIPCSPRASSVRTNCAGKSSSSPTCASTKWRAAPTFFCIRTRARIWCGFPPSRNYILDNGLAKTDSSTSGSTASDEYRKSLEPFTLEFAERDVRDCRSTR